MCNNISSQMTSKLDSFSRVAQRVLEGQNVTIASTLEGVSKRDFFDMLQHEIRKRNYEAYLEIMERVFSEGAFIGLLKDDMHSKKHFFYAEKKLRKLFFRSARLPEYVMIILEINHYDINKVQDWFDKEIRPYHYRTYEQLCEYIYAPKKPRP